MLAKELQQAEDSVALQQTRHDTLQAKFEASAKTVGASLVGQSQQFRKLSQDLFDVIGLRESENDFDNRMQRLASQYEQVIKELEGRIQSLTAELDIDRVKRDLQNFTFNTMNERQEQIVN